jgi:hypothetical protein
MYNMDSEINNQQKLTCLSFTESSLEMMDNHLKAEGILLDLSKVYDVLITKFY